MATFFWNTPTLAVGSDRIACSANSVTVDASARAIDSTTFCSDSWVERIGGMLASELTIGGFWELTTVDGSLFANLGSSVPFTVAKSETEGDVAYFAESLLTSESMGGSVGDAGSRDLTLPCQGRLVRGTLLQPSDTDISATGSSTGVQHGSVSAAQSLYAVLHVVEAPGSGTLDVIVESDDNSGFTSATTRVTFSQLSAATGSEWATPVAGAISDDYWRVGYTLSAGTWKFAVAIGIAAT